MKIAKLIIVVFLFLSCSDSKKESENISDEQREEQINKIMAEFSKSSIQNDTEKIALISALYEVNKDTVQNILIAYTNATEEINYEKKQKLNYNNVIDSISTRYNLKKTKTAKIISTYKFGFKENTDYDDSTNEE